MGGAAGRRAREDVALSGQSAPASPPEGGGAAAGGGRRGRRGGEVGGGQRWGRAEGEDGRWRRPVRTPIVAAGEAEARSDWLAGKERGGPCGVARRLLPVGEAAEESGRRRRLLVTVRDGPGPVGREGAWVPPVAGAALGGRWRGERQQPAPLCGLVMGER